MRDKNEEEKYIFISYSHKDMDRVLPIIKRLRDFGCRIWYDDGIDPGTEWAENIAGHVRKSSGFLAFVSKNYMESSNCKDELEFARDLDKKRILIYLEEVQLSDGMAMRLNRIHAIHMYRYCSAEEFEKKLLECSLVQMVCGDEPMFSGQIYKEQSTPVQRGAMPGFKRELYAENTKTELDEYILLEQIGGGISQVYRAYDRRREKVVTVKVYSHSCGYFCPIFGRGDLERDLGEIDSPHICKLLKVKRGENSYLVMGFLDGITLREAMDENSLGIVEALKIVRHVLLALGELHGKEIFYGDVTPFNIMLVKGSAVLCDFSSMNYSGSKFDDSSTVLLNRYRSPEKDKGNKRIDCRSDIYEIGIILDEMTMNLLGEEDKWISAWHWSASEREKELELQLQKRVQENPLKESYMKMLFGIIKKATCYDKEERYQSVDEMMKDLDRVISFLTSEELS